MTTVAPCVVSPIACLLCSSPCLRVDKHMIQIDVPPPTLRPPERDLSVSLPPDVPSSICLAHLSSPRGCRRVQPFLPMLTKWWGVRFAAGTETQEFPLTRIRLFRADLRSMSH
jgi:hypothetical protein